MRISVAMLAKNAVGMIEDALTSIEWADEVVVGVDDTTTDDTAKVAKAYPNVRVIGVSMAGGFGKAKNQVIDNTRNEWVLVMDTDERVSPELKEQIEKVIPGQTAAFEINRLNYMLGRPMRFGGWWPDYQMRLFNKTAARYSDKPVHEELQIKGPRGRIEAYFEHLTHPTIASVLDRVQRYSAFEAELIVRDFDKTGRKVGAKALIGPACKEFWRRMVLRRAYKDGMPGFIEAVIQTFYVFVNYAKAWELQQAKGRKRS